MNYVLPTKGDYQFGWHDKLKPVFRPKKGISTTIITQISSLKKEPDWMKEFRLKAYQYFLDRSLSTWGPNLSTIDFANIYYYLKPTPQKAKTWAEVPPAIRRTYERLGIPEAERRFLAGVEAQFDSEMIYGRMKKMVEEKGVIFVDTDTAVKKYPELVGQYFAKVVPPNDNKFAALNSAVWSGGSFIYVPKGVKVDLPLQAYFRINADKMGQFERTLIIAEEGSQVSYVEGCSSPVYSTDSLHAAVVEIIVKKGARVRYTTIQNWSKNVYNLVTKRAKVEEEGMMEWVDANLGCLAKGTKIFGNPFVKNIEDIRAGDKVLTYNGETKEIIPEKVLGVKFSGLQRTFKISLGGGKREIMATPNHPFLKLYYDSQRPKKSGRYWFRWTPLGKIKVGDYLLVVLEFPPDGESYKFRQPYFRRKIVGRNQYGAEYQVDTTYKYGDFTPPEFSSVECMWLLGVYVGDGSLQIIKSKKTGVNRYARVTLSVPERDLIREKLEKSIAKVFGIRDFTPREDGVCITYNSLLWAEWLELNGFSGNAHTKRLPSWLYSLPRSQKLAFIAGYCEADGFFRKGSVRIKSCNRELVEDIRLLALSSGMHVNKIKDFVEKKSLQIGKIETPEKEYRYTVTFISNLQELSNYLVEANRKKVKSGKPRRFFRIARTRRLERLPLHLGIMPVSSIVENGFVSTYDLEIPQAHNFVANGLVVHNSQITMKYPSCYLVGRKARGEVLSMAFAGAGQILDTGAKMIHLAPETSGTIISKGISKDGGKSSYRGLVQIKKGAINSKSKVKCEALILDEKSKADSYPHIQIDENQVEATHEAVTGKLNEDQLFYLQSRGLDEQQAETLLVNGFIEPIVKELPMEYAVEMNRLLKLEMTGSVG